MASGTARARNAIPPTKNQRDRLFGILGTKEIAFNFFVEDRRIFPRRNPSPNMYLHCTKPGERRGGEEGKSSRIIKRMHPLLGPLTSVLSLLTIAGQFIVLALIVLLLLLRGQKWPDLLTQFSRRGLLFAWIVSIIATIGSLTYSNVIGLEPCMMCWFQRICMYPQVLLLGLANYWKDARIIRYSLPMVLIGAALSTYHYTLQLGVNPYAPCSINGHTSCTERMVFSYGYITIPMMALTAFLMIAVFLHLYAKSRDMKVSKK